MPILTAEHLKKTFWDNDQELIVLRDVSLELEKGEFACISGKSGCGKSTLMHILGLLDKPDSGKIFLNGAEVTPSSIDAPEIRNRLIGFVFQFHYLMEDLTALENVALPLMVSGLNRSKSLSQAKDMLRQLDIGDRLQHYPHQLSGGEQQRVALGRALINNPAIVLADEPTGNLDPAHSSEVLDLLVKLNKVSESAFILVTHDMSIADRSQTHYNLEDGRLLKIRQNTL